ncbi:GNAT family N-acetyltransferase [uncultured Pseudodesulfovibrio sp.]|uniref:GNAT family N-acetyltransferase n=1 Tax=uncultured Pseudodesulfovibrio sp. TaxID=2035858 RepID=UPI0029C630CF|nr:GNAT family N-acetyltransferase [uncultured Pseudodesulfovibrio sp.]
MNIEHVDRNAYDALLAVWESSVRATHDFLQNEDIEALRPLILEQYFEAVELRCAKNPEGKLLGFCGVAEGNLEMLFVASENQGKGVGKALCLYAIEKLGITKVDVNEQNPQAIGFYEHMGFRTIGRSPLDGQGKPFPLLHMELTKER